MFKSIQHLANSNEEGRKTGAPAFLISGIFADPHNLTPYPGRVGLLGRTLNAPEGERPMTKPMKRSSFTPRKHLAHGGKWDRPADRSLPPFLISRIIPCL